jgi:hypothetical protein
MLSNPIKVSTFIFAIFLAFVSMVCSLLLWISFANTTLDTVLAAITSIALVGTSYIFVPVMIRLIAYKKIGFFIMIAILELMLVASSLGATIGWLESRYQGSYYSEVTSSDSYNQNKIKFDDYTTRINELTTLAKIDTKNNFRQRAERLLNKADRLSQERNELANQKYHHTSKDSGTTLANDLGESRYVLWTVLAVLVDGCPMACFAILSAPGKRTEQSKPAIKISQVNNKIFADINNPHALYETLASEIKAGIWGDKPAMRNIITTKRIRHSAAKEAFDLLVENKVLKQNGNRFERAV